MSTIGELKSVICGEVICSYSVSSFTKYPLSLYVEFVVTSIMFHLGLSFSFRV